MNCLHLQRKGGDILSIKGIILAAGFGKRLYPITRYVPKSLLPIGEETILDLIIKRNYKTGLSKIAINTHHLARKIKGHMSKYSENIFISHEKKILGTGGGIRRIAEQSNEEFFLIQNGDIYAESDLTRLVDNHRENDLPITVFASRGGTDLDVNDNVGNFGGSGYTYIGTCVIDRNLALKLGRDLIPSVQGNDVGVVIHDKPWFDIGSPEGYLSCIRYTGGFIAPSADLKGTEIEGNCYVGPQVRLRNGRIKDAIILSGSLLQDGSLIENAIIAKQAFINC